MSLTPTEVVRKTLQALTPATERELLADIDGRRKIGLLEPEEWPSQPGDFAAVGRILLGMNGAAKLPTAWAWVGETLKPPPKPQKTLF